MVYKTEITGSSKERNLKNIKGFYSIIENQVHLFISTRYEPPYNIEHLRCKGRSRKHEYQFLKCRTLSLESDFDEYLVEDAYIGENESSFTNNKYSQCRFSISNDIYPRFDTAWDSLNSMSNDSVQTLKFKPREERYLSFQLDKNTIFTVYLGYTQSYSQIRYEAHASIGFRLEFTDPVSRETIFELVDGILDFYSLFCIKRLKIWSLMLEFEPTKYLTYYGTRLSDDRGDYFGNLLFEHYQIKEIIENSLSAWIENYNTNKIALDLIHDAQDLKDEELRFICLMRCLEIFHKENFVASKPSLSFLEELHTFLIENNLSDISLARFKSSKIMTLSHRLYDLARSVFDYIKKDKLMFGYITNLNRCQQLADTRNYYIHFSEDMKQRAWDTKTLPHINFQLTTFIKILFLKRFNFTKETIKTISTSIKGRHFF